MGKFKGKKILVFLLFTIISVQLNLVYAAEKDNYKIVNDNKLFIKDIINDNKLFIKDLEYEVEDLYVKVSQCNKLEGSHNHIDIDENNLITPYDIYDPHPHHPGNYHANCYFQETKEYCGCYTYSYKCCCGRTMEFNSKRCQEHIK